MSAPLELFPDETQRAPLVLITDDQPPARQLIRHIFERAGFRVQEAEDGPSAIALARALRPDLILMDIQMPGLSGFDTVQRLREDPVCARMPIIIVTANARQPQDVVYGLGLGADDYLLKPFNNGELLARARAKISARQLEDKLAQRTTELETLVRIGYALNQAWDVQAIAQSVLEAALRNFHADHALLVLLDEHGALSFAQAVGGDVDLDTALEPDQLPGYALQHGSTFADGQQMTHLIDGLCATALAVRLTHHEQIVGLLTIGSQTPDVYDRRSLSLLEAIAEQAALAVRKAQLYAELQRHAQNLEGLVEERSAALQQAQLQLVRADKLAALGTLAAGIAHEVNTPLQPLLTNLEVALEDLDAGQSVDREALDFSIEHVHRIKRIVSGLLDFARPSPTPNFVPGDLNTIVVTTLNLISHQFGMRRITVETRLRARQVLMANTDQLSQVVLNLFVNAQDAMPDGGTLTIRTMDQGDEIVLTVQDTGVGIPPERLAKIFDPFFTTKATGTGLGLAVSYGIVQSHGGRIDVESRVGEGTRFTLRLPALLES